MITNLKFIGAVGFIDKLTGENREAVLYEEEKQ